MGDLLSRPGRRGPGCVSCWPPAGPAGRPRRVRRPLGAAGRAGRLRRGLHDRLRHQRLASSAGPTSGCSPAREMVDKVRRLVDAVDGRSSPTPTPATATRSTSSARCGPTSRPASPGIHLEDQVMPKKCGHMSGKAVIRADEMVGKIRAAVEARRDPDLVLIARTDAAAVQGLDDAIDRGAGLRRRRARTCCSSRRRPARTTSRGWPAELARRGAAGVQLGRGRPHPADPAGPDRRARASRWCFYPIGTLLAATAGDPRAAADPPRPTATPIAAMDALPTFDEFTDLIGLPEVQALEARYAD